MGVRMIKKDKFVKVAHQDIEDGYEYCTVNMKNTALKTFTMKRLQIGIYLPMKKISIYLLMKKRFTMG